MQVDHSFGFACEMRGLGCEWIGRESRAGCSRVHEGSERDGSESQRRILEEVTSGDGLELFDLWVHAEIGVIVSSRFRRG